MKKCNENYIVAFQTEKRDYTHKMIIILNEGTCERNNDVLLKFKSLIKI